ncbi:MAG: HAMP domain-containing histidine kinase [Clostridiaceae bacterium]|nr:HAMP domain-containing histidine kinase [Clostridiaceae bacterium]
MMWIILLLMICCIFLLARLILFKKVIRSITNQLDSYSNLKTHKKIDISLFDKDVEALSKCINEYIDVNIQTNVKRKQAEDELKKAIANISHDLRTPLTSILGYIQMIKSKKLSQEKQDEYLDIAERRAKSLKTLLSDFFELSIIESNEYNLELEFVDLNKVLCEVITSFYDSFIEKNINPQINLPEERIMVVGNAVAIKRVIENLLINIIKHAEKDVSINLKKDNDRASITTINSANNVWKEDVNLLFNRLYNADASRTNINGNTGLGLSIVKSLMENMEGSVYAEVNKDLLYVFCKWKIK